MEQTFKVTYTINKSESWRSKEGIEIKSNIADDELIDCRLAKSLVDYLKTKSAVLEPDKLLLTIAETQRRGLQTILEEMEDTALQAKTNADKAHEIIIKSTEESEKRFLEIEKKFSNVQKLFNDKIKATSKTIDADVEKIIVLKDKLDTINNFDLSVLADTLRKIVTLTAEDPELVRLVLDHKKQKK